MAVFSTCEMLLIVFEKTAWYYVVRSFKMTNDVCDVPQLLATLFVSTYFMDGLLGDSYHKQSVTIQSVERVLCL